MSRTEAASDCDRLMEAVSARIDGEDPGMTDDVVDAHLARCPACRSFEARASAEHRTWRVRPAGDVPDLSGRILAAIPGGPSPRPRLTVGERAVSGRFLAGAAVVVVALLVAGYVIGGRLGSGGSPQQTTLRQVLGSTQSNPAYPDATVLPPSQTVPKPDVVMTDTSGRPYNIATDTRGRVTLLYFGYTHCPDLCPLNMGLAAEAVHGLPPALRKDVTVVFVTTDPTRDTPSVIRRWLAQFTGQFPGTPSFVGLTAPQGTIHTAEKQIHMLLSYAAQIDSPTGKYNVVHAAYTQVYGASGTSRLQVTYNITGADYTKTLEDMILRRGPVS